MYQSFHHQKASFPDTTVDWRELIYMRSWQAAGLVKILYYFIVVVALITFLSSIISYTIAKGAGGFFLGLLVGTITAIFMILSARIGMEAFLSLVAIRDSIDDMSVQRTTSPATTNAPYHASTAPVTTSNDDFSSPPSYQTL